MKVISVSAGANDLISPPVAECSRRSVLIITVWDHCTEERKCGTDTKVIVGDQSFKTKTDEHGKISITFEVSDEGETSTIEVADDRSQWSCKRSVSLSPGQPSEATVRWGERVRMHLDEDRDGLADEEPAGGPWTWGLKGRGATIVCNLDISPQHRLLAPIEFRRCPASCETQAKLGGRLKLGNPRDRERIRIFNGQGPDATQILGKGIEAEAIDFEVPCESLQWGMDAARHDESEEDQDIELIFTAFTDDTEVASQFAKVHVAPWMMLHHLDPVNMVYCAQFRRNNRNNHAFLDELARSTKICSIPLERQFIQDGMEIGYSYLPSRGKEFVYGVLTSPLQYWQEAIKREVLGMDTCGVFSKGPQIAQQNLLGSLMSYGNLEVTPPVGDEHPFGRIYFSPRLEETNYDQAVKRFLHAQKVQAPFELDASWLDVGHVDEIVTFLPVKGRLVALVPSPMMAYKLLFKVALHAPRSTILSGRKLKDEDSTKLTSLETNIWLFLLFGAGCPAADSNFATPSLLTSNVFGMASGKELLDPIRDQITNLRTEEAREKILPQLEGVLNKAEGRKQLEKLWDPLLRTIKQPLLEWRNGCYAGKVAANVTRMKEALGEDLQIVEVPVIFFRSGKPGQRAVPLTANMVNMLVLEKLCVFPKPFGPVLPRGCSALELGEGPVVNAAQDVFEQYMLWALRKHGIEGTAIDDWECYHFDGGNVHCGTNALREPDLSGKKWWQYIPRTLNQHDRKLDEESGALPL